MSTPGRLELEAYPSPVLCFGGVVILRTCTSVPSKHTGCATRGVDLLFLNEGYSNEGLELKLTG